MKIIKKRKVNFLPHIDVDKNTLKNKIALITRINKINDSNTTVEKIWFIVNANKIIEKMKAK